MRHHQAASQCTCCWDVDLDVDLLDSKRTVFPRPGSGSVRVRQRRQRGVTRRRVPQIQRRQLRQGGKCHR